MSDKASDGRQHRRFTFECGVEIELRRVPPLTIQEFGRQYEAAHKPPEPPMQTVDYGAGPVMEPNRQNSEYMAQLSVYQARQASVLMDFILLKGTKLTVDADALAEARADAEASGFRLDGDDRLMYLKHVLIGTNEELVLLRDAILLRGQPTEAAIAQKQEDFKS